MTRLKSEAEQTVVNSEPIASHREEKIAEGRLEIRKTYLYNRQNSLDEDWKSINLIVYVRREFLRGNREHKSNSLYVSDLSTNDAKRIAEGIRAHWHIENKLHYTGNVTMCEDTASTSSKTVAANLALLGDFTFNILKSKNKSIK